MWSAALHPGRLSRRASEPAAASGVLPDTLAAPMPRLALAVLLLALTGCRVETPGGPAAVAPGDTLLADPGAPMPPDTLAAAQPEAGCMLVAQDSVTLYARPSVAAVRFGVLAPGDSVRASGRAPGFVGIDPGTAQAANVGPFRLRYASSDASFALRGACDALPAQPRVDPVACYLMALGAVRLHARPDTAAAVVATVPAQGFAEATQKTPTGWLRVRLGPGRPARLGRPGRRQRVWPGVRHAVTVAFQGWPGAYSEAAARARFGEAIEALGRASFEAAVRAAAEGRADAAVIPVRNSTTGLVDGGEAAAALGVALGLVRAADETLAIHHALLALPGVSMDAIRVVWSHPQALAQTARWTAAHLPHARPEAAEDTAGAARDIADSEDRGAAAVAHASAASRYGLAVLADGIEDEPGNATTFAVLVRR